MRARGSIACAALVALITIVLSCGDDPSGPGGEPGPDSAWMVVERLETAYNERDFDLFRDCLDDGFEYHYPDYWSSEWYYWGLEYEELCHDSMFHTSDVYSICLTFSGDTEWEWLGGSPDSTIRELTRDFDLYVFTDSSGTTGFHAQGSVVFVCRPDSTGTYRIWYWTDYSDFKQTDESTTWPDLKQVFL